MFKQVVLSSMLLLLGQSSFAHSPWAKCAMANPNNYQQVCGTDKEGYNRNVSERENRARREDRFLELEERRVQLEEERLRSNQGRVCKEYYR
jgi:hypothetical protein